MNIRVSAAVASVMAMLACDPAAAQKYFARERIVGLPTSVAADPTPTPTPTPTPAATWSYGSWTKTCTGATGKETRTATCSTGTGCDAATKEPISRSATCASTCSALVDGFYATGSGGRYLIGNYKTLAGAQQACSNGKAYGEGACHWVSSTTSSAYGDVTYVVAGKIFATNPGVQGSMCGYQ